MKNKIQLLIAVLLLSALRSSGQTEDGLFNRFQKELQEKNAGITSIECSFRQTRSMSILLQDAVKSGTFHYQKPDRILFDFDDGDFIRICGADFQIRNAGKTYDKNAASAAAVKSTRYLVTACLDGRLNEIARNFKMEVSESSDRYTLRLRDSRNRKSGKINSIILIFEKSDLSLSLLELKENSGDFTRYEFTDKKFNLKTDPELFRIR